MSLASRGIYTARVIRPMTDAPISVGPLIVPEPTIGANPATKNYVDEHGGSGSQNVPQQQIIYLSAVGNDATADGLTLNTAFGTLTAAAAAANAVATSESRVVINCADATAFTMSKTSVTLNPYVDLYAPNATIELDDNFTVSLDANVCVANARCSVVATFPEGQALGTEFGSFSADYCGSLTCTYVKSGGLGPALNSSYLVNVNYIRGRISVSAEDWQITINTTDLGDQCDITTKSTVYLNTKKLTMPVSVDGESVLYLKCDSNIESQVTTTDTNSTVVLRSALANALVGPRIYNAVPYTPAIPGHPEPQLTYNSYVAGNVHDYELYRRGSQVYLTMGAHTANFPTPQGVAYNILYETTDVSSIFNDLLVPNVVQCTAYTPLTVVYGSSTYNTYGTLVATQGESLILYLHDHDNFDFSTDTGYVQVPSFHMSFPGVYTH